MRTNILISGFFEGFPEVFIQEIVKSTKKLDNFVFISADFSKLDEKTILKRNYIIDEFKKNGIEFKSVVFIDKLISKENASEYIKNTDLVWVGGGDTLMQMDNIRNYNLVLPLSSRVGLTVGMSAGAINMAKRVVLAKDESDDIPNLSIYEGIGLTDINIEPHLNSANKEHLEEIKEASTHSVIVGLNDGDFLVERNSKIKFYGEAEFFDNGKNNIERKI